MTADPEVRAKRRVQELKEMGLKSEYDKVLKNLLARDKMDSERELNPLKRAKDAILLDTSKITFNEQVETIVALIKKRVKSA